MAVLDHVILGLHLLVIRFIFDIGQYNQPRLAKLFKNDFLFGYACLRYQ
jgi:hypothetical protein